jgi:Flagellar hook-length control protein FliK
MAIDPVLSVSFDALRALSLADAMRDGRILEAKVTAMLSDTLARLSIAGQDIDVMTPQRLPVGAQLTLRAEREAGQLRLVTQAPIRMPDGAPGTTTATAAQQAPDIIEPGKTLMAQVHAIAVEAMLGDATADEEGVPPASARLQLQTGDARLPPDVASRAEVDAGRPASMRALEALFGGNPVEDAALPPVLPRSLPQRSEAALFSNLLFDMPDKGQVDAGRLLAVEALLVDNPAEEAPQAQTPSRSQPAPRGTEALPVAGQQPPETQGKNAPDAPALASMLATEADRAQPEARRDAAMDAARAYVSADTQASQAQAGRHAPLHIEVPVYFPGNPQPLRLQVTRDDGEPEEGEGGEKRPRSWTIRFAAEAGSLGMIHAAISMVDERIGVQLWAEKGDTAAWFRQDAAQLQDALEASDLKLDALKILQGSPPAEGSAAEEDAGR